MILFIYPQMARHFIFLLLDRDHYYDFGFNKPSTMFRIILDPGNWLSGEFGAGVCQEL